MRGRFALGEAYRLAGLGRGDALFAPAYHCITMIDPAIARNATIRLYPVHPDLSPDMVGIERLFATHKGSVKALLATHFFGFAQDFSELKRWCDKRRICLIEDCSHVLFTEAFQAQGTGSYGEYVVASPYKFFPCEDGGLLYSRDNQRLESVQTTPAGLAAELLGIKRTLEKLKTPDTSALNTQMIEEKLRNLSLDPLVVATEEVVPYVQPSQFYKPEKTLIAMLRSSRFVVERSSVEECAKLRRRNYQQWAEAMGNMPNCKPLYPNLPAICSPYMFPLHIEFPTPHFYWLKYLGVPIWRWDEMTISECSVAQDYRLHLLHLPCHQSLTEQQMDWMIAAVKKTLVQPRQRVC